MMITPPLQSKIRVENADGNAMIIIPQRKGGFFRYLVGIFMLFWLGAWAVGWGIGVEAMVTEGNGYRAFILFWLGTWTVGGLFAMFYLYRLLQRAVPETIVLASPEPVYDSGIAPLRVSFTFGSQRDAWKRLLQKRYRTTFSLADLATLRLRDFESGNRLTIDQGVRRIDLAAGVNEPEREWLYGVLKSHYPLQGQGENPR